PGIQPGGTALQSDAAAIRIPYLPPTEVTHMKFSEWTDKVRALFRPGHRPEDREVPLRHDTEASNDKRSTVEIHIPSTGECFVPDASLSRSDDFRQAVDEKDIDADDAYAQHVAWLENNATEALAHWDGKSVRDIATEPFHEFPHLEAHLALQKTVPPIFRDEYWDMFPRDDDRRSSLTLLAIDKKGEALVKSFTVDDRLDAEGQSYNTMPVDQAFKILREYGASPGPTLDAADSLSVDSVSVQPPAMGVTYRGEILAIEGDTAYQMTDSGAKVAHLIGSLAVKDSHQYLGKTVEISYPCGQVGLLRQLDDLEVKHTPHGLDSARRDHSLER
uniref:KfrB domain-containing protein n=1 Tax=Alcaligenes xylosoxydans xylosoxydans TaxID=85698 RepID=UPI001F13A2C5